MAIRPGEGQFPHLFFEREPEREPERRRSRGFGVPPPAPPDRRQRGEQIGRETAEALEAVQQARRATGIDPTRLLVLEFESINFDARDVFLNRFGATVVDERMEGNPPEVRIRTIVQFPTEESLQSFVRETVLYREESPQRALLPLGMRRSLLDGLQRVRPVTREERSGRRLRAEGLPPNEPFYLDVDLWHPGDDDQAAYSVQQFRDFCRREGGQVAGQVRTSSMVLLKVHCPRALAEQILDLDVVARVDLPPKISATVTRLFGPINLPNPTVVPDENDPLACVVDSGVVAGHPLLLNWVVEERDFDSGENSEVDRNGHGTAVAGLVVYGDIAGCLERNEWAPRVRICSAKVLRSDPNPYDLDKPEAIFPDENRVEQTVESAIRYFFGTRNCRIFNLSVGNKLDVYAGERQFSWAEKLDELARELDIVIVVAAGNQYPGVPEGPGTVQEFQLAVRDQLLAADHRVCNPATSALALAVGAIARSEGLPPQQNAIAGSPERCPSPFTRTGPGYAHRPTSAAIKPDLVDFGGNKALQTLGQGAGRWIDHLSIAEPTIRREIDGRFVGAETGTSFACPHVTHAAAIAERTLAAALGAPPSANLIRALVASTSMFPCPEEWLGEEEQSLRLIGYGLASVDDTAWSRQHHARVVAMDEVMEDRFHIYRLPVPEPFLEAGRKGITVALAYDPPVRASRKEYLARTMEFEVLQGLTTDETQYFRQQVEAGQAPKLPAWARVDLRPTMSAVEWSTLQVRRKAWLRGPQIRDASDGSKDLHLIVRCQQRFRTVLDPRQRYGLVVNLWHEAETVQLYQALQNLVRIRVPRIRLQR